MAVAHIEKGIPASRVGDLTRQVLGRSVIGKISWFDRQSASIRGQGCPLVDTVRLSRLGVAKPEMAVIEARNGSDFEKKV